MKNEFPHRLAPQVPKITKRLLHSYKIQGVDMYILSQDKKKLINLDNYTLSVFGNSIVCDKDILTTVPYKLQNREIGEYESTDRAKEVLYEIFQYMKPIVAFQNMDVADNVKELFANGILIQVEDAKPSVQYIPTGVYEMPEV